MISDHLQAVGVYIRVPSTLMSKQGWSDAALLFFASINHCFSIITMIILRGPAAISNISNHHKTISWTIHWPSQFHSHHESSSQLMNHHYEVSAKPSKRAPNHDQTLRSVFDHWPLTSKHCYEPSLTIIVTAHARLSTTHQYGSCEWSIWNV